MTDETTPLTRNEGEIELLERHHKLKEMYPGIEIGDDKLIIAGAYFWGDDAVWTDGIVDEVWSERLRQIEKRGLQERASGTDANQWVPFEAAAKAMHDLKEAHPDGPHGPITWVDILKEEVYEAFAEEDPDKLRVELIQVMAVAASWIQDLDRRGDQAP